MPQIGRIREFLKRNIVSIVVIPSIVLIHYGWDKLQDIEIFVPKEMKKPLPVVEGVHYIEEKIEKKIEEWKK